MYVSMLKGKIHRCTVTHADLQYEGSVTISEDLMAAVGILENEQIHVWDVTNGQRLVTYAMRGERGAGMVCINGAAAHLVKPGDVLIIAAFVSLSQHEAERWRPAVVFVDEHNCIRGDRRTETAGPARPGLVESEIGVPG